MAASQAAIFVARAAFANALGALYQRSVEKVVSDRWSDDQVTPIILRAAVDPASIAVSGWAGILATQATGDYVGTLAPTSAASAVFARAFRADLDGMPVSSCRAA